MLKSRKKISAKAAFKKGCMTFKSQLLLQAMVIPGLVILILFAYLPIYGVQIAFRDFKFNLGITGSPWVGFKFFEEFLTDPYVPQAIFNTIGISFFNLLVSFPLSIILAIMINEVSNLKYKKFVQTVSYMPYFISWTILAVMATSWLSPSRGFINGFLTELGILEEPYHFLGKPEAFWPLTVALSTWKGIGWSTIVYLSVIVGISPELYESAHLDGANIFQRAWYITIPGIMPTVMLVLILNVGSLVRGNFSASYLLGNTMNISKSQIIETYTLKLGMNLGRYSYASAVGLLQNFISMLLVLGTNWLSNRFTGESLF